MHVLKLKGYAINAVGISSVRNLIIQMNKTNKFMLTDKAILNYWSEIKKEAFDEGTKSGNDWERCKTMWSILKTVLFDAVSSPMGECWTEESDDEDLGEPAKETEGVAKKVLF